MQHRRSIFDLYSLASESPFLALVLSRGPLADSAWVVQKLATLRSVVVASPALLQRVGRIRSVKELRSVPCITTAEVMGGAAWYFLRAKGRAERVEVNASYRVDSGQMALEAARAGVGFALLPWVVCRDDLKASAVCRVKLDRTPAALDVYLARPHRNYVPLRVSRVAERLQRTLCRIS